MLGQSARPAPTPVAAAPAGPDRFSLPLRRQLQTHEGLIAVLKFREPIGDDFAQMARIPIKFHSNGDGDPQAEIDFKLAMAWLARLTNYDEITLGRLSRADFIAAVARTNEILLTDGAEPGN